MRYYRCKCGKSVLWTTDGVRDCEGCEECNTTYSGGPNGHSELKPHTWKIMYNQNTGKPYKICSVCGRMDEKSYKESSKKDD
jgi:hypothetical protein